jgi:hypothetical protein
MIEKRSAEGTIPQPTNGRIGPFGNSSTDTRLRSGKEPQREQEVCDASALPDNDSRYVTGDGAREEVYSQFDGLAEMSYLPPIHQWPILGPAALSPCETSVKRTVDPH